MFALYLSKFADGCYSVGPKPPYFPQCRSRSRFAPVRFIHRARKGVGAPTSNRLARAIHRNSPTGITATLPSRKKDDLCSALRSTLSANRLTPGSAAELRGRLGFAQSLLFGRLGRAHLAPITARQYAKFPTPGWRLAPELRGILNWRIAALGSANPRTITFSRHQPVLFYTDASGNGHLGVVIIDPINGRHFESHTHAQVAPCNTHGHHGVRTRSAHHHRFLSRLRTLHRQQYSSFLRRRMLRRMHCSRFEPHLGRSSPL